MNVQVPPTLNSIVVTPANPNIFAGATQPFTATGTYSDGSTQNITSQAIWASSSTAAATINLNGLAAGVSAGTTTISAALGGKTGTTTLTVQAAPVAITTPFLPNGVANVIYSTQLTANGGAMPYTWSLASGLLPAGLTLNATSGAIIGTPTNAGIFSFAIQVTDASNPAQKTTNTFSIAITATPTIPILVLTNVANPFSGYYAEILLTEGLNEFALTNISSVSSAVLANYDVVILGQVALTAPQVTTLSNWVSVGGKLIAMRPDKQLAGLLGLADAGSTLSDAYLLVNTTNGPSVGIVGQTIQFHGIADRYTLASASSLATLFSSSVTPTANPAVTLRSVGANGGQAAAFTYDLARSVVYTRQGNPAWAGRERDGLAPMRPDDLFFGAASSDPQTDWVDLNKVAIPQADEQQRLLANMILSMNSNKKLLPRFWYLPHGFKAAVVMTGDDHAYGGAYAVRRFNQYLAAGPLGGAVDDWETPRCTAYIFSPNPGLTDAQVTAHQAAGFEISMHLNTGCVDYTPTVVTALFSQQLGDFENYFPSVISPTTHRIHCIAWSGYTAPAEVGLQFGIRLETSYYYWPGSWVAGRPGLFTGSGMPMRFATTNGNAIDVYQAPSQMTDESGQSYPYTIDTLLDRALGPEGFYGAFVANMHTDSDAEPEADAILSSALSRGVPIISARQLLTWLDARNSSSLKSINWNSGIQTFSVDASAKARGLQAMVPVPAGYGVSVVSYNGNSLGFSRVAIKGIRYAIFDALTGNYQVNFVPDTTAPSISSTTPANGATGVSPTTEVRVTFSETMDPATINSNTIRLLDSVGNVVAASVSYDSATLTAVLRPNSSLRALETYTAGVAGGATGVNDFAGNARANDFVWAFTTASQAAYSLWNSTAVPGLVDGGADGPVELGVKFRADAAGSITGIRFYKASANTGTHVANLWASTGTLLATATFTGETASGWQQVNFTAPVAINANTIYVASYHPSGGHYSADINYFATTGVDNGPLHALANGVSGGNGVYAYGVSSIFPSLTWNAANYWVDVVFK